jgi:2,4-dienoyl-CoA reductase-like NADH-dependent reductase (Old Yellow Enzyme family)
MNMLNRVERYLRRSGLSASHFGRLAMRDPSFVRQLRNGRELRPETVARLAAWIAAAESAERGSSCAR